MKTEKKSLKQMNSIINHKSYAKNLLTRYGQQMMKQIQHVFRYQKEYYKIVDKALIQ